MPTNDDIVRMCLSGDVKTTQQMFNQQLMNRVQYHIDQRRDEIAQSMLSRVSD